MAFNLKISNQKAKLCIRLFLCLHLLLLFGTTSKAKQYDSLSAPYQAFLNADLQSTLDLLDRQNLSYLDFYLKSLTISASLFLQFNEDLYKENRKSEDELIDALDEMSFTEEELNFLKSEIKLQWALLKLKNGDEFAAFWSLKQAYSLSKENVKKHPDFIPSYKTLGLLHVMYGAVPDRYDWILSLFGLEGDIEKGLSELETVHDQRDFLALESSIVTSLLHAYLLNDPASGVILIQEQTDWGSNLMVDYAWVLLLMKHHDGKGADAIMEHGLQHYTSPIAIPHFYYLLGELKLQRGEYTKALEYYDTFLSMHKGDNQVKDAYYKSGVCNLMLQQEDKASVNFENARTLGKAKNEADKHAQMALESENEPNIALLKLRYATDGGFYEQAKKVAAEIETTDFSKHDQIEFLYRKARLFHHSQDTISALRLYDQTIKQQKEKSWYFAPNAALQASLIYAGRQEYEKARTTLDIIDQYSGYPYQSSIRQKAKTARKKLP